MGVLPFLIMKKRDIFLPKRIHYSRLKNIWEKLPVVSQKFDTKKSPFKSLENSNYSIKIS